MALNKRNHLPLARAKAGSPEPDPAAMEIADSPEQPDIRPERSLLSKFHFVFRHLWIIGLSVIAGLLIAIGYVMKATPIYQSTIVLRVAQQEERDYNPNNASNGEDDLRGDDILNTITQSLKLDSLYDRVANDPAILQDTNIVPAQDSGAARPSNEELANKIQTATSVVLRRGTRLIDVSVKNPVPEAAQKLAMSVVNQFIASSAETDIGTSSAKRTFLLDEVNRTKLSLQKSADGLEIYKEALRQKQRVDDQQKVVDDLSQRYLEAHPKLIQARSLMADLKLGFDAEIKKVIASSPTEAAYWTQNENSQTPESQDDLIASELKLVEARTSVLQSEVDTEQALFDGLLKQMREEDVQTESAPIEVKVVDPANLPAHPVYPNPPSVICSGILGGFILGMAVVMLLQRLDSTFSSAEDVEQFTDLPVIATIPLISRSNAAKRPRREAKADGNFPSGDKRYEDIVLIDDPSGIAAENIRNLWAALELVGKEEDRRITLFSSALPGEGKTFTSCNYAVSLAQHGLKTLLIDADLRRPGVPTRFHLENNRPGLTEHVAKGVNLSEVVHRNVVENLDIMLTGGKCPNPAEFLSGKGFIETLEGALLKYDRVVVDSPPIILVCDTRLIAPYVQTICLVVKAESTSRHAVRRALSFLEMARARPVGIIYNCVPSWSIDEYHGYSYSGKYKYGEAYGESK
ncbi:MAG: polysaccharide biosynthesis tyrosine autokinase [Methylacidiphilales bacterium]|nr:polysaccharide biosynthesis tyrosine autokinase [Candidatus Methylacidiphilales bacterium]